MGYQIAVGGTPAIVTSGRGSYITTVATEREMTVYPLLDAELKNLQMFTRDVTLYTSIATGFAGYGIGSLWEWYTTNDQFNDVRFGIWLFCFAVSLVSGVIAARAEWGRENALEEMKRQAKTIGAPVKQAQ